MKVLLARPRGFCAGVDRAIEIVDLALDRYGPPVWVRHEIVHNRHVVERLRARGARFTDDLSEVPEGSLLVFSAHGVSPAVRAQAAARRLRTLDATCPLVTKVHLEALRFARAGRTIVLIGHRAHVEIEGTLGEAPEAIRVVSSAAEAEALEVPDPAQVSYLTQTTLSLDDVRPIVEALRRRFPSLHEPPADDICYATQNRQNAVRAMAPEVEVFLILGAPTSSNTQRLLEVARASGVRAYRIESAEGLDPSWLSGVGVVGVTAGASAPESLVEGLLEALRRLGATEVEERTLVEEHMVFALPAELRVPPRPGHGAAA